LKPFYPAFSLRLLRYIFVTWRLGMADPMTRVQSLMGHADANTLLCYAHAQVDPMVDLLRLLQ